MKVRAGTFAPWGRWEMAEDGRVMLSFRCSCSPRETVNEYVAVHEAGHAVDLLCPRCRRQLVQVRVSLVTPPEETPTGQPGGKEEEKS